MCTAFRVFLQTIRLKRLSRRLLLARHISSEGFTDLEEEEVMDVVRGHAVELSEMILVELVQSTSEEDKEDDGE